MTIKYIEETLAKRWGTLNSLAKQRTDNLWGCCEGEMVGIDLNDKIPNYSRQCIFYKQSRSLLNYSWSMNYNYCAEGIF